MKQIEFERCKGKTISAIQLSVDLAHMVIVFTDETFCSIGIDGTWLDYDCTAFFRNEKFIDYHFHEQVMKNLDLPTVDSKTIIFPKASDDFEVIGAFIPGFPPTYIRWALPESLDDNGNVTCKKCGHKQSIYNPLCQECCPHDELVISEDIDEDDDGNPIVEWNFNCKKCLKDFDLSLLIMKDYKVVKK